MKLLPEAPDALLQLHAILSHGGRSTPGCAWVRASQAWVASPQLRLPRAPLSVSFLRKAGDPEETPRRPCGHASAHAPCSAPGWCSRASERASPRPAQQRGLCSRSHVPTLRGVRVFTSPLGAEPHHSSVLPRCSSYAEPEASSDHRGVLLCSAVLTPTASLSNSHTLSLSFLLILLLPPSECWGSHCIAVAVLKRMVWWSSSLRSVALRLQL